MIDPKGRPLSGYVVKSPSSQGDATTDVEGKFSLDTDITGRVMIFVDKSSTIVDSDKDIEIVYDPASQTITSAAGIKVNTTRSSAAVDIVTSEDLENYSGYSSSNVIIGKLASLSTLLSSGSVDDDYVALYVRGKATSASSNALVLVDGFESSINRLSNLEIESITVLKDAVALAPYGLRGANGVVLVTTKSGTEGKPQFRVNVEYGVSKLEKRDYVGAAQYASMVNEARANDGLSAKYSDEQLAAQGTDQYLYPDMDWVDEMIKPMSNYTNGSLEMTGGSSKIRYYTMFDYKRYNGALNYTDLNPNYDLQNDMSRLNFRSNISLDITKTLSMGVKLGGRIDNSSDIQYGTTAGTGNGNITYGTNTYVNNYYNYLCATPANRYSIYNADGSYNGSANFRKNPYAELVELGYFDFHERTFDASVDLNYSLAFITEGLSASAAISFASEAIMSERYNGGTYAVYEPTTTWTPGDNGLYAESLTYNKYGDDAEVVFDEEYAIQERTNTMRFGFDYDRTFGDHSVVSTLIGERSELNFRGNAEAYKYVNFALSANYGFKGKYFADFVLSYAGSNAYESGNNMGFFPAAGLSWIASGEDFLNDSSVVDYLKFRASAGITGASPNANRFLYLNNYTGDGKYYFGQSATATTGLSESALMDPDFSWERGYSYNFGFDSRLFSNKVNFSFDAFVEKRANILDTYDEYVTSIVIYPNMYDCYAQVLNKGVDFTLGYGNSYKSGFAFSVAANGGFAKNKILQQYELENGVNSVVGYPVNSTFGYEVEGFYSSQEEIDARTHTFGDVQLGDIKYVDRDRNNVIDEYDKTYLGSSFPTFNFGLNLNASFCGVYVDAWFDGMAGGIKNVASNAIYNPLNGGEGNISAYAAENYWTAERADSATLPRLSYDYNRNNSQTNSLYLLNSSFMRLRTAEVGYSVPSKYLEKLKLGSVKLYLRGHNLFVVDAMDELDPEVTSGYPIAKSVYVGLNVGF